MGVAQAKGMGIVCTTDLSKHPVIDASAPGIQGSLCDKCAASCKAEGQDCSSNTASAVTSEAEKDLSQDEWEKEWDGLKNMGGCAMVAQAKGKGIVCTTDLSKHPVINASAPGIQGSLCDKCAASCKAEGQDCSSSTESAMATEARKDLP